MTGLEELELMADNETVTLTKGQIKALMKDAAKEAVMVAQQKQEQQEELTREQIMQTKDGATRRKLIRENLNLFSGNLH